MFYQRFNNYIYDCYFNSKNIGDEIIMSVDSYLINDNIPNYIGLIAIQIYIASEMKDETEELLTVHIIEDYLNISVLRKNT